ncbi:MAG: RNA polymerase sigma factor, RpoD/SigA family [cyanobacterium endosymbiont of Epithemia adnata isolate EadnSB Bon19]
MPTANVNSQTKQPMYSTNMVRTYLHEIGRVPLLTHEQEIIYGKQVQRMMSLLAIKERLTQDAGQEPSFKEWAKAVNLSQSDLKKTIEQGNLVKRKMIEGNLRLVVAIAKKYQKRNMEFLDLIQEGSLGLARGVEKFDPTKGYKFSTYAYWWIRQAITRAIAQQARTIRLPIYITEKLNKIKKIQRELSQELGCSATPTEIGAVLNLEASKIWEYLSIARQPISLDVRLGDNQDTELLELLEDRGVSPDNYILQELLRQDLRDLMKELTLQQQMILTLRFGLEDGKELSLAKIGKKLNISRERVLQLEHQALAYLRRSKANIKQYLAAS